jgi:hypothetical protein
MLNLKIAQLKIHQIEHELKHKQNSIKKRKFRPQNISCIHKKIFFLGVDRLFSKDVNHKLKMTLRIYIQI